MMDSWSSLDFLFFFIFFLNSILGLSRGATKEIISSMCLMVALIFLIKFTMRLDLFMNSSPIIQDVITSQFFQNFMAAIGGDPLTTVTIQNWNYVLSVLITFVGAFCAGEAVLAFSGIHEVYTFPYAAINRKLGGALGFLRGYVLSVILVVVLQHLYLAHPIKDSYFMNLFSNTAAKLDSYINNQDVNKFRDILKDKDLYKQSDLYNTVSPNLPAAPATN